MSVQFKKPAFALLGLIVLSVCGGGQSSKPNLLQQLINALNSKDRTQIETFLKANSDGFAPVATRLDGMMQIAERGAPFRIKKVVKETPSEIQALVTDAGGIDLGMMISLSGGENPKLGKLQLGPPSILEEKSAKTYTAANGLLNLCKQLRADHKLPAIGIFKENGFRAEIALDGTRTIGGEKVQASEPWRVGSIGKSLCTSVIGKLIESKKLNWTTTIGEVFPTLKIQNEFKKVTVEQLMQHRSGVPTELRFTPPDVERIIGNETDPLKMRERYLNDLLSRKPISTPGTEFQYSNGGYVVLGAIAEKVTGKRYEALVKTLLFTPLKLKNSYVNGDQLPANRPRGHVLGPQGLEQFDGAPELDILTAAAGGGMYMSLPDLASFGRMHLDGLRGKDGVLKATTIRRLHNALPEGGSSKRKYGAAWCVESLPEIGETHWHNGSNGTMYAHLSLFPEKNLVVASIMNQGSLDQSAPPPLLAILAIAKESK